MSFQSILFPDSEHRPDESAGAEPDYFRDLHLDQIVDALTAGRTEYALGPFFWAPLREEAEVEYRQEVMRDLEDAKRFQALRSFSEHMQAMRRHLTTAEKLEHPCERQRWHLEAALVYCAAVEALRAQLDASGARAHGLRDFQDWLEHHVASADFRTLAEEARAVAARLAAIRYSILIKEGSVTVKRYESEIDYAAAVEKTFAKFRQGAVKDYRSQFTSTIGLNPVEGRILDGVVQLNPEAFRALASFHAKYADFAEPILLTFEREAQFYLAVLELIAPLKRAGSSIG